MLEYEAARKLYEEIKSRAANFKDPEFHAFYTRFLQYAVEYSSIRTGWTFLSYQECVQQDAARHISHDAFISILSAVCRNLQIEDMEAILPDRKAKGDFACYISLFLGIEHR